MATLQLKDTELCDLGLEVRDKKGIVTTDPLDAPPAWASSNETVATVAASADGMSAMITAGTPGSAQINVAAVNAGAPIVGTLDVQVVPGDAAVIAITTSAPAEQP